MAGGTYDPPGVPLARGAAVVTAWKFPAGLAGAAGAAAYPLPNVQPVEVRQQVGPEPSRARFRFKLDQLDPTLSTDFADYYPVAARAGGPYMVRVDDKIAVTVRQPDGYERTIFAGYAATPEVAFGGGESHVTFGAVGREVRVDDVPILGAVYRSGDWYSDISGNFDVPTTLPVRFNPDGHANATPEGSDTGAGTADTSYPVFLDWRFVKANPGIGGRRWTLAMAVRYLLATMRTATGLDGGNPVVDWGGYSILDRYLVDYRPVGGDSYDVDDPATYTTQDIILGDVDVTGMTLTAALDHLLRPHNFKSHFPADDVAPGPGAVTPNPWTPFVIWRACDCSPSQAKPVFLQAAAAPGQANPLDPARTNVGSLHLARDMGGLANAAIVRGAQIEREVSVILAPGFPIAVGDAADGTRTRFVKGSDGWNTKYQDYYRLYIYDEVGEGHWDFKQQQMVTGAGGSFDKILGGADPTDPNGRPPYVNRRRPGKSPIFTLGPDNATRRKAELRISFDYAGQAPVPYSTGGTWHLVNEDAWELLDDRLGIRLNVEDPNELHYALPVSGDAAPGLNVGTARIVEWTADPTTRSAFSTTDTPMSGPPYFMLTCVVDADQSVQGIAPKRGSSPTQFTVQRLRDDRDHFKGQVIDQCAYYSPNRNNGDTPVDDDSDACKARAESMRAAHELPVQAGSVTIPRIDLAYQVGDFVSRVTGRDMDLQSNLTILGRAQSPVYPAVVGVTYHFDGQQSTTLDLTDVRREDPEPPADALAGAPGTRRG